MGQVFATRFWATAAFNAFLNVEIGFKGLKSKVIPFQAAYYGWGFVVEKSGGFFLKANVEHLNPVQCREFVAIQRRFG